MNKQIALAAVLAVAVMLACVAVSDTSDATIADIEKPDTVTNPGDGTAICTVDGVEYMDFSSAITAATESDKPMVLSTDYDCGIASIDFTGNLEIDLNGKTLAINLIVLTGDESLTISNGTLFGKFIDNIGHATITAKGNASIVLDDVDYYSEATGAIVYDKASVTLRNGTVIHADGYGLGTNASEPEDYDVRMTIRDSAVYADPDPTHVQTAILFNIPGTLTIENSTIQGYYQAVIVRGGEAVITNSTITNTMNDASLVETFENEDWGTGNAVPTGALIVGNKSSSYQYPTTVDITDSDIVSNGTAGNMCAAVTVCANTGEGLGVEMVYDELSTFSNGGDEPSITIGSGAENVVAGNPVIMVGEKGYVTLQSAIADVPTDDTETTITLLDDISLSMIGDSSQGIITIPVGANVIIDLNGNDITVSGNESGANQYAFSIYGEMTLRDDSQEVGKISSRGVDVESGGVFNLESGTIDVADSTGGAAVYVNGEFNMSGGILMVSTADSDSPCIDNRVSGVSKVTGGSFDPSKWTIRNLGTLSISSVTITSDTVNWNSIKVFTGNVTIENCTFDLSLGGGVEVTSASGYPAPDVTISNSEFTQSQLSGTQSWNSMCVAVSGGSSVTVNDCTFNTVAYGFYVFSSGGSIEVNGGTYTATGDKPMFQVDADTSSYPDAVSSAVVNGGTFKGELPTGLGEKESLTIYGGKFLDKDSNPNTNASQYVAEGYTIDMETGSVVLADDVPCVAKIGDREFSSLEDALEAVQSGQTIQLQQSIEIDSMLNIYASGITIDLNDFTITASDAFTSTYANDSHLINIATEADNTPSDITIQNGKIVTTSLNKHAINVYAVDGVILKDLEIDSTESTNSGIPLQINGSYVTLGGEMTFRGSTVFWNNAINIGDGSTGATEVGLATQPNTVLHFTDCSYGYQVDVSTATAKVDFGEGTSYDYEGDSFSMALPFGDEATVTGFADDMNRPNVTFAVTPSETTVTISQDGSEVETTTGNGMVELDAGTYDVTYTLDGYQTYTTTVTVGTENVTMPAYTMQVEVPEPESYNVDFYVQGTLYKRIMVPVGEGIPQDEVPFIIDVDGYMFDGWEYEGEVWFWDSGVIDGDMRLDAILYEIVDIAINVAGDTYMGETVTLTPDFDTTGCEIIAVAWGFGTTSDIDAADDYGVGESVTATKSGYYFVMLVYSDGTDIFVAMGSTHLVFTEAPSQGGDDDDTPVIPPIDDDDDYVPLPPHIVVDDSDSDDATTAVACAAAAVVAAILAAFIVMEYRRK